MVSAGKGERSRYLYSIGQPVVCEQRAEHLSMDLVMANLFLDRLQGFAKFRTDLIEFHRIELEAI